ncbi:hypothetical protein BKA80DRAFT_273215 [Phyllosticta citrichinensis]
MQRQLPHQAKPSPACFHHPRRLQDLSRTSLRRLCTQSLSLAPHREYHRGMTSSASLAKFRLHVICLPDFISLCANPISLQRLVSSNFLVCRCGESLWGDYSVNMSSKLAHLSTDLARDGTHRHRLFSTLPHLEGCHGSRRMTEEYVFASQNNFPSAKIGKLMSIFRS